LLDSSVNNDSLPKAGFPLDNFFARSEFFICVWAVNWNHLELIG
jgi:hypothetical protein